MVAVAEEYPSVGLVSAYSLEGLLVTCIDFPYRGRMVSGCEICREQFLKGLYLFGSANCILYRADLIRSREPFYNETNVHANTEACFALLMANESLRMQCSEAMFQ